MARIDYLKVAFSYDGRVPGAIEQADLFRHRFTDEAFGYNVRAGTTLEKWASIETLHLGERGSMVLIELWGEHCDRFIEESHWFEKTIGKVTLMRADIRYPVENVESLDRLFLTTGGIRGTNVQTFRTRERAKKGDRDAGGIGFAVGSHKSDRRMVAYRRGSEEPALECQFRKRALEPVEVAIREGLDRGTIEGRRETYSLLRFMLEAMAHDYVGKKIDVDLQTVVEGGSFLSDDHESDVLEDVERKICLLSKEARAALLKTLSQEAEQGLIPFLD